MRWVRAGTTPQRVVRRARIALLAGDGLSSRDIAERLDVRPSTVLLWRARYAAGGPSALWTDAPGRGRKPAYGSDVTARILTLIATTPPRGSRWSIRDLAAATGVPRSSLHRILTRLHDPPRAARTRASTAVARTSTRDPGELPAAGTTRRSGRRPE